MAFQRKKPAAIGAKAPYPGFIEPALATSIAKVPRGTRWVHEIKFDGYRVQVHLRDAAAKIFTRRGNDWTNRFRKIAADACHINAGSAIIDGEVVVPSADGTTDFSVLQNELKGRDLAPKFYPVLSSPRLLDLPGWAVVATGAGAEPLASRSARSRRGWKVKAYSEGVFHPSWECGREPL